MEHYYLDITAHPTAQPSRREIVEAVSAVIDRKVTESDDELLKQATGFKVEVVEVSREEPADQINWGYNCLTQGVHHGRPEPIWNLSLLHAFGIFQPVELRELVLNRIYNDAMLFVRHGEDPRPTEAWATRVMLRADELYDRYMVAKTAELHEYYEGESWRNTVRQTLDLYKAGKLNGHFQPLHGHDSINLFCRILGTTSSRDVGAPV